MEIDDKDKKINALKEELERYRIENQELEQDKIILKDKIEDLKEKIKN